MVPLRIRQRDRIAHGTHHNGARSECCGNRSRELITPTGEASSMVPISSQSTPARHRPSPSSDPSRGTDNRITALVMSAIFTYLLLFLFRLNPIVIFRRHSPSDTPSCSHLGSTPFSMTNSFVDFPPGLFMASDIWQRRTDTPFPCFRVHALHTFRTTNAGTVIIQISGFSQRNIVDTALNTRSGWLSFWTTATTSGGPATV
jgi:hypothetical protein